MKCVIDTNVIISTLLFPGGTPAKAFAKALAKPNEIVICEYILDEVVRSCRRKDLASEDEIRDIIQTIRALATVVRTPEDELSVAREERVRDIKDRVIFRTAVIHNADCIISGDKDVLEADFEGIFLLSPAEFLKMCHMIP
ncbi:MAG: putative toxin-antitoxin system toxin component, PIN family [Methanomassiliicoccaceae archaeon]|nr:putative toxin-antitoxin system toxin component, PIN family [Methanomassiliicoccaceae archaeon]